MKFKQVVVRRFGGPEVLEVEEIPFRSLQPGEVRVKMLATGVAWGDTLSRQGFGIGRPPFTPGYDIVGIVDEAGADVASISVGQLVAALPILGGYSEYMYLPVNELVPVPATVDPAEAACLVLNYVSAHQLLQRAAQVREGEHVLVFNAGGGVGTALLQLGQLAGLNMFGVTSKSKMELVNRMGGTAIDRDSKELKQQIADLTGGRLEVVFDPFGGSYAREVYGLLSRGGRAVVFGAHTLASDGMFKMILGFISNVLLNLIPDSKRVLNYSITRPKYSSPAWCREDLSMLLELLAQERIKPLVADRIPLSDVIRAHETLASGSVIGKLMLVSN